MLDQDPKGIPACLPKGFRPRISELLHRERLYSILDRMQDAPLTWVTGPPGSGKTTLLSGYIESRDIFHLWYQLDTADSDVMTFFHYLTHICATHKKTPELSLPHLDPECFQDMVRSSRRYIEKLFTWMPANSVLILDNYQEISAESDLHILIRECLLVLPIQLRIMIISRQYPPPPMVRAKASQELEILGWDQLRLTAKETDDFISLQGIDLPPDDLSERLFRKTDGWIAGLTLMLKSPGIRKKDTRYLDPFTMEIFEYFEYELFEKTRPEVRSFLMVTAILPCMTVASAKELTGNEEAEELLLFLNRQHYFLDCRLGEQPSYQYHQLFREFLLSKANTLIEKDSLHEYKAKAAELMKAQGCIEPSYRLYQELEQTTDMVKMICSWAPTLMAQNRYLTLEQWIQGVPPEVRNDHPWLLYWHGLCCLVLLYPSKSHELLEKSLQCFESEHNHSGALLALSGLINYTIYNFQPFDNLDPLIDRVAAKSSHLPDLSSENKITIVTSMLHALTFRRPNHPEYPFWKQEAQKLLNQDLSLPQKVDLVLPLLWHALNSGQMTESFHYIDIYSSRTTPENISPLAFTAFENHSLYFSWLSADFTRCQRHYKRLVTVARTTGMKLLVPFAMAHLTAAALGQGDLDRARELIAQMEPVFHKAGLWGAGLYYVVRSWAAMLMEEPVQADFYAEKSLENILQAASPHQYSQVFLGRAITLHMQGKRPQAWSYLSQAIEYCQKIPAYQTEFACRLTRAEFALDKYNLDSCLDSLRQALRLGRVQGYRNTIFWRPRVMARLCDLALEHGIETEYVQGLMRQRGLIPAPRRQNPEKWPWPLCIYTLGRFRIYCGNQKLNIEEKDEKQSLRLLQALIALGEKDVAKTRLQDALWPDLSASDAQDAFTPALQRLRTLLQIKDALQLSNGRLCIDSSKIWIDVAVLREMLDSAERSWQDGDPDKGL
ncbi:MAG: hypothetical protein K9K79_09755, partial [Desulfohalobiaceae bacterium]|nr:hypothetical protein [Desulfohalobiaceae bacterium]